MKRRGSVVVFVTVLIAAMGAAIVVMLAVATNSLQAIKRREDTVKTTLALEGAIVRAVADHGSAASYPLPVVRSYTVGGLACSLSVSDNGGVVPGTLRIEASTTYRGRSYAITRVVGVRKTPSPFYYALWIGSGLTMANTLSTGSSGANGDVYVGGPVSLLGASNIVNGELESTSTVTAGDLSVSGSAWQNAPAIPKPGVIATDYQTAAGSNTVGSSLNGLTFSTSFTTYYPLHYAPGDLSIRGTFRNKGTIFVNGNVTVSGNMSYFDANSRVAIVATGNITFSSTVSSAVGYFYGNALSTGTGAIVLSRGGIVANSATVSGPLSVTNDPAVWLDSGEGKRHRLPGFWP